VQPAIPSSQPAENETQVSDAPGSSLKDYTQPPPVAATPTPAATLPAESENPGEQTIQERLSQARRYVPAATSGPRGAAVQNPFDQPSKAAQLPAQDAGDTEARPGAAEITPPGKSTSTPADSAAAAGPGVLFSRQGPALSIETSGPQRIKVGVVAAYNVVLRNHGPDAEDVVVTVKVPDGADLVNANPSEGTIRPASQGETTSVVEWSIPRLGGQTAARLGLRLIPRKSRPLDLAVHLRCAPIGSTAQIEVQEARLLMTLSGPEEVFYGERELYKLTLSNPGNGDAENVLVRLLPTTPGEDQAVTHQIGLLKAGENKVVELELTARQVGSLRLKAEAIADGGLHAAVDEEVLIRRADLKINVEGPSLLYAGTSASYRIHVSNPGNAVAKNVQIAAILPSGAEYESSTEGGTYNQEQGRILWTTTNLRPGGQWTATYRCQLAHPGGNATQIVASAEGDLRQIASVTTTVEALADLTLSVKDPTGPVPVGQDASYEIHVCNRGSKSADGVEVVAFFSPGIEPTEVQGGPHEIGPGQISMAPVASIGPGQEVTFTIKARAHRAGNHVFRAEVSCSTLETKLAAEETTRFYGEDLPVEATADQPQRAEPPADEPAGRANEAAEGLAPAAGMP
jgi:uncharacterized repeat protein (TIGR01451 family)